MLVYLPYQTWFFCISLHELQPQQMLDFKEMPKERKLLFPHGSQWAGRVPE